MLASAISRMILPASLMVLAGLFGLASLGMLAAAIYLGWATIASPPIAALAASISYLTLAVALVGIALMTRPSKTPQGSMKSPGLQQAARVAGRMVARKPALSILGALAAGFIIEHLDQRRS